MRCWSDLAGVPVCFRGVNGKKEVCGTGGSGIEKAGPASISKKDRAGRNKRAG